MLGGYVQNIYANGEYLEANPTWHSEDSPWKAGEIAKILKRNGISPAHIGEIGCGTGAILRELSHIYPDACLDGWDISAQALALAQSNQRVQFHLGDLLSTDSLFDVLLVIDVFEHVPDYMGFLQKCRTKATYKVYHIPLDIHVSSVVRGSFVNGRKTLGHIHYFSEESALATLKDTGHQIIDLCLTANALGLFKEHATFKRALANVPRWLVSRLSPSWAARLFGGFSLMVLAT